VPTRISLLHPSVISSSDTIVALGQPMPVPCTETGLPLYVPVKPSNPRSVFLGTRSSRYVSEMDFARSRSPGGRTASAWSSGSARMWIGIGAVTLLFSPVARIEPSHEQVLEFCGREPVERVFLEDVARRGLGRFYAVERSDRTLESLCHVGANLVPSGTGC